MHEQRQQADLAYQQSLREQRDQEAARRIDSPEKRKHKLLQSFQRHKVQMVSFPPATAIRSCFEV